MCSTDLLSRVIHLLKANVPKGISLMDVNREYYYMFGHYLNPTDYGYKSSYELFEYLSEITQKSVVLVKHSAQQLTDWLFIDETVYQKWIDSLKEAFDFKMLESLVVPVLPKDVSVQHIKPMPLYNLPEPTFNATVVHICCPNRMFIRLAVNEKAFKKMRNALRFYDNEEMASDYVLPPELLVNGYLCAAQNPLKWDNWSRVIILATDGTNTMVQDIDSGNKFSVKDRTQLMAMKESFCSIPPLVIEVSMSGIASTDDNDPNNWSEGAKDLLSVLCNKTINFFVVKQLDTGIIGRYSVLLRTQIPVFPLGNGRVARNVSVYFHEQLIYEGFARVCPHNYEHIHQQGLQTTSYIGSHRRTTYGRQL